MFTYSDSFHAMKSFIVHVSDASQVDVQSEVNVNDSMDLGRVAQLALDEVIEKHGGNITFPIFIDIHPASNFQDVAWMHHGTGSAPSLQAPTGSLSELPEENDKPATSGCLKSLTPLQAIASQKRFEE